MKEAESFRQNILRQVASFYLKQFPQREFLPGETRVPVSGRTFDADELVYLVDASLDF